MTMLEQKIDNFLALFPDYAIILWNAFIGNEDNGTLHTGRRIESMGSWHSVITEQRELETLAEGIRRCDFDPSDKYFWLIDDDEQESDSYQSFNELYSDYRNELAELIAEHRVAILDEAHKTHIKTELVELLKLSFADKYLEVFGIDAIDQGLCPRACGFDKRGCGKTDCDSCVNAFWNSPYEREYNLKH